MAKSIMMNVDDVGWNDDGDGGDYARSRSACGGVDVVFVSAYMMYVQENVAPPAASLKPFVLVCRRRDVVVGMMILRVCY